MGKPQVYGADYSVYVRIARLALYEKGVDHDLIPVDVFAPQGAPAAYRERQPFGKIPSFEHDGFRLYETGAITRYVDEAFRGPALQPFEPKRRARMNQIVGIADGHIYPGLVWGLYVELVSKAASGEPADQDRVASARAKAPLCLDVLADFLGDRPWLAGDALTLADLYLAPMIDYFLMVPEGRDMFFEKPTLGQWWQRIAGRDSMRITRPETQPGSA